MGYSDSEVERTKHWDSCSRVVSKERTSLGTYIVKQVDRGERGGVRGKGKGGGGERGEGDGEVAGKGERGGSGGKGERQMIIMMLPLVRKV